MCSHASIILAYFPDFFKRHFIFLAENFYKLYPAFLCTLHKVDLPSDHLGLFFGFYSLRTKALDPALVRRAGSADDAFIDNDRWMDQFT